MDGETKYVVEIGSVVSQFDPEKDWLSAECFCVECDKDLIELLSLMVAKYGKIAMVYPFREG